MSTEVCVEKQRQGLQGNVVERLLYADTLHRFHAFIPIPPVSPLPSGRGDMTFRWVYGARSAPYTHLTNMSLPEISALVPLSQREMMQG